MIQKRELELNSFRLTKYGKKDTFRYTFFEVFGIHNELAANLQIKEKSKGSVQEKVSSFSKHKTKIFDHYMDYYCNMNIEFYVPDKKISRKC